MSKINFQPSIVIVFAMLVSTQWAYSQADLPSGKVEVVRSFEARLIDTDKVPVNAPLPQVEVEPKRYEYTMIPSEAQIKYTSPEIRPLAMPQEKQPEPYNGLLKGGFGYPLSPYAEAGYYFDNNSNFNFLGHLKHHSANDNRRENQRFMDNDLLLRANYYFDQGNVLGARFNYSLDDRYFYGYDETDTSFMAEDARRRFNTWEGGVSFKNSDRRENDINYWANFDMYSHKDNLGSSENGQLIRLGIEKYLGGKHPIFAEVITDFSSYEQNLEDFESYSLNNFFFVPGAAFQGDFFQIRGAVRIASNDDNFSFFPDIKMAILLADGAFNIMAGWNGDLHKNNFRNLTDYNPFLNSRLDPLRNSSFLDYYGGFYGMLNNIQYEIKGGYKNTNDMALFVPNFEDARNFFVLYDTVSTVYVKASGQATFRDQLTVGLSVGYNGFTPVNEEKAWHIPELESNLSIIYRSLDKKFRFTTEIYYMNGLHVPTELGEVDRLNNLFDMSFNADYMINKNFGLFANLNNLAGNRWQRWFNYPTFGLNVLGGVILRF